MLLSLGCLVGRPTTEIVLVSHSHGGNVAKLLKNQLESLGWRVDVINIETPQRADFQSDRQGNGVYLSFYYSYDFVQQMGSRSLADWTFFLQSGRIDNKAGKNTELHPDYSLYSQVTQNILTGVYIWYLDSLGHGLHNNPTVRPQIIEDVKNQFKLIYK